MCHIGLSIATQHIAGEEAESYGSGGRSFEILLKYPKNMSSTGHVCPWLREEQYPLLVKSVSPINVCDGGGKMPRETKYVEASNGPIKGNMTAI